jgi:uncharacterized protein YjbI with pentapeptide repeats
VPQANFSGASLDFARMTSGTVARQAVFDGASLRHANLDSIDLHGARSSMRT